MFVRHFGEERFADDGRSAEAQERGHDVNVPMITMAHTTLNARRLASGTV